MWYLGTISIIMVELSAQKNKRLEAFPVSSLLFLHISLVCPFRQERWGYYLIKQFVIQTHMAKPILLRLHVPKAPCVETMINCLW